MKCRTSSKMGLVGSKTRSLGWILEKPCVPSKGHIFSLIIMKHDQNVCLEISDEFENWSCRVRMFVLMKSRTSLKMGHVGSKTRSLGHILEKPCVPSRGHNFNPIIMKLRIFVLMKSSTSWKMGYVRSKTSTLCQILEKA